LPNAIQIRHETTETNGRYVLTAENGVEAKLTYIIGAPGVITIDHTFVPDQFRGQGIAAALVARAIEDARQNGTRIIPQCSYVAAQFRRHPEWADLLHA
jgi:uncharacterized protein